MVPKPLTKLPQGYGANPDAHDGDCKHQVGIQGNWQGWIFKIVLRLASCTCNLEKSKHDSKHAQLNVLLGNSTRCSRAIITQCLCFRKASGTALKQASNGCKLADPCCCQSLRQQVGCLFYTWAVYRNDLA